MSDVRSEEQLEADGMIVSPAPKPEAPERVIAVREGDVQVQARPLAKHPGMWELQIVDSNEVDDTLWVRTEEMGPLRKLLTLTLAAVQDDADDTDVAR